MNNGETVKMKYGWEIREEVVNASRFFVTHSTLHITDIKDEDYGEYVCHVKNMMGDAAGTVLLKSKLLGTFYKKHRHFSVSVLYCELGIH